MHRLGNGSLITGDDAVGCFLVRDDAENDDTQHRDHEKEDQPETQLPVYGNIGFGSFRFIAHKKVPPCFGI